MCEYGISVANRREISYFAGILKGKRKKSPLRTGNFAIPFFFISLFLGAGPYRAICQHIHVVPVDELALLLPPTLTIRI